MWVLLVFDKVFLNVRRERMNLFSSGYMKCGPEASKLATGSSTDISICAWLTLSISWLTRAYFCLNGNVFVPPWVAASFHCFLPSLDQAALLQFSSLRTNSEHLVELDAKHYFPKFIFYSYNSNCVSSVMIAMLTCIQCSKLIPIIHISLDIGQKSDWQQCVEPNFVDNCDNQNRICISCSRSSTAVERSKESVNWRCNEYVRQLEEY